MLTRSQNSKRQDRYFCLVTSPSLKLLLGATLNPPFQVTSKMLRFLTRKMFTKENGMWIRQPHSYRLQQCHLMSRSVTATSTANYLSWAFCPPRYITSINWIIRISIRVSMRGGVLIWVSFQCLKPFSQSNLIFKQCYAAYPLTLNLVLSLIVNSG